MKRFLLIIFSFFSLGSSYAQDPVLTSLNENFDVSCASTSGFPTYWHQYNQFGSQTWQCTQGRGIDNTPCISINDYTTKHNADTVWLITPKLDLHSYSDIYLNFFTKYSRSGDTLQVYVTNHYGGSGNPLCDSCTWSFYEVPFSQDDTVWREHQINLDGVKSNPLYVAFVYTSTATQGSIWYLDSVFTTQTLSVGKTIAQKNIPVTVLGMPGANGINLEYTLPEAGNYQLNLYDVTGRILVNRSFTGQAGVQRSTLTTLNLPSGMYIIKLYNQTWSGYAKVAAQ